MREIKLTQENKDSRANRETPPFAFRFSSRRLKTAMEKSARKNHRTLAGEINSAMERHVMGVAK